MKILHITRNLPPLVGGMERLNWNLAAELAKTHEVKLIGPKGSVSIAPAIDVYEVPLQPLWKFLFGSLHLSRRIAKSWKPDIVLGGSGLIAPVVACAARTCDAKTVLYVHGLDVAVQHPLYKLFWLPAIRRADRVIANSRPTRDLCLKIGVAARRIGIVYPGVERPSDSPAPAQNATAVPPPIDARFRTQHDLGDRPLLLSVGRLSARKGLLEFIEQAMPRIVAAYPEIMLLVVGDAPKDALYAQPQSPESIRNAAKRVGVENNLKFLGVITDYGLLGEIYRTADAHVFPVRTIPGDPEGFGMVAVEAASHGLPTVAFATGGIVDAVLEGKSGHLVAPSDYAALADRVIQTLNQRGALRQSSIQFAQQFEWSKFGAAVADQLALTASEGGTQ